MRSWSSLLLLALFTLLSSSYAYSVYYVTTPGSGTTCTSATPCSFATAMGKTLANGDYISLKSMVTIPAGTTYTVSASITIEGNTSSGYTGGINNLNTASPGTSETGLEQKWLSTISHPLFTSHSSLMHPILQL